MNDQLEVELREVFNLCAAEVPTDAEERLRRIDYGPRRRRRWPLTIGAAGAASGTAAVVSVVVLGGSQAAFAGWVPTPATPTAVQSAVTQGNCEARLQTVPGTFGEGSWSQVGTDVRGPYTMTVFEDGNSLASCFTGPSFTTMQAESLTDGGGTSVSASGSAPGSGVPAPGATGSSLGVRILKGGDVEQLLVSHLSQAGNGSYTLAEGRIVPAVTAVSFVLSNGQDVTATTGSGWIVAWWPGNEDVTSVQVTTASGTTTEPLTVGGAPLPPLPNGTSVPTHGSLGAGAPALNSGGGSAGPSTGTQGTPDGNSGGSPTPPPPGATS